MSKKESVSMYVIQIFRKRFRNTWLHRLKITNILYKKIFSYGYGGVEKEIVFRGAKYLVPTKDATIVPSMISGDYEQFELNLFRQLLHPGDTVLDIGANIGVYSVEAARGVGKQGRVHAFEPIPENLKLLRHNVQLNNLHNINVVSSAVGNHQGKLKLYTAENNIGTHSAGAISNQHITIPVTTIDAFAHKLGQTIDLIKMDIEGYEGHALEGAIKTIRTHKPVLFIEFSADHLKRCNYDPEKHAKNLLKLYPYCYRVEERKKGLVRMTKPEAIAKLRNDNLILSHNELSM